MLRRIAVLATVAAVAACQGGSVNLAGPIKFEIPGTFVHLDASACTGDARPLWVAFQDGNGPWRPFASSGPALYVEIMNEPKGAFAVVRGSAPYFTTDVIMLTRAELGARNIDYCRGAVPPTRTATANVSGLGPSESAEIAWAGGTAFPFSNGPATLLTNRPGAWELVAWRHSAFNDPTGARDRAIKRNSENPVEGGAIAPLDFDGPEAFTPSSVQLTIPGLLANETPSIDVYVHFGTLCDGIRAHSISALPAGGQATYTVRGMPTNILAGPDFHDVIVSTRNTSGPTTTRYAEEATHFLQPHALTLPPPLAPFTMSLAPGSQLRPEFSGSIQPEFNYLSASYSQVGGPGVSLLASVGYYGGGNVTLATPDFSGLAGWNAAWGQKGGGEARGEVVATATNRSPGQNICVEGSYTRQSVVTTTP